MGRFFLPWYSLLLVLGLFHPSRYRSALYAGIIITSAFCSIPRSWVQLDAIATLSGFATVAALSLTLWYLTRPASSRSKQIALVATAIALAAGTLVLRDTFRYRFYRSTDKVYDVLYLGGVSFSGEAAEIIDQPGPLTVNFAADYGGVGYRWFRYIYLGSRLQNKVVYIAPTVDGSTWSRSVTKFRTTDYDVWRKRLVEAGVDYMVTIKPFASELDLMPEHSPDFRLTAIHPKKNWAVYQVMPVD
jgi:hypothetical protein